MKTNLSHLGLVALALLTVGGCGVSQEEPPKNAVMHKMEPLPARKTNMTKEEKIAAIQKAGIPDAQKKEEIAKVNDGKD